jgi:hypothetical protein
MGSALLLLDLSAAFDTVDHQRLLKRLACTFGVTGRPTTLGWFQSFLSDQTQSAVKALGVTSLPNPLSFGVPQGSVLGPSLFSVYTSPVPAIASRHGVSVKQFSDDTQEYVHFWIPIASGSRLTCWLRCWHWRLDNRVKLNLGKSLLLYAVPQLHSSELVNPPLVVGDVTLPPSGKASNLGVLFDSSLSIVPQINSVCKCAFFTLLSLVELENILM